MSVRGRVRQFVRAVTERMDEGDRAFVRANLPAKALPLFAAMHPAATLGEDVGWAVELIPLPFYLPG